MPTREHWRIILSPWWFGSTIFTLRSRLIDRRLLLKNHVPSSVDQFLRAILWFHFFCVFYRQTHQMRLPGVPFSSALPWQDVLQRSQLRDCLVPLEGLYCDFSLQLWRVNFPFLAHMFPPKFGPNRSLNTCPNFGDHFSSKWATDGPQKRLFTKKGL